jgi:hypothetical protein
MGYYIHTEDCTLRIPAANLAAAWDRFAELDKRKDLQHHRGEGLVGFSFLPINFTESINSVAGVLEALGFDVQQDADDADLYIHGYNDKAGQEDLFLFALSGLMDGYVEWMGEDGSSSRYTFHLDRDAICEDSQRVWTNARVMPNPLTIPVGERSPYTYY